MTVQKDDHIEALRQAIADNESNLAKMKGLLADLEKRRTDSQAKHDNARMAELEKLQRLS